MWIRLRAAEDPRWVRMGNHRPSAFSSRAGAPAVAEPPTGAGEAPETIEELQNRLRTRTQDLADKDAELQRLRALLEGPAPAHAAPRPSFEPPEPVAHAAPDEPEDSRRMTVLARIVEENIKLRMRSSDP